MPDWWWQVRPTRNRPVLPTEQGFAFEWFIPEEKFAADEVKLPSHGADMFIHAPDAGRRRTYYPLASTPDLFHRLRKAPTTVEGAVDFANAYGPLEWNICRSRITDDLGPPGLGWGFWLKSFRDQVHAFNNAWRVWEAASEALELSGGPEAERPVRSTPALRELVGYRPGRWYQAVAVHGVASVEMQRQQFTRIGENNRYGAALEFLAEVVTEELAAGTFVAPALVAPTGRGGVVFAETLRMRTYAESLRAALWLQFASVITGGIVWRTCAAPGCSNLFPVGADHFKVSKRTCSEACRQRLSRQSRRERTTRT